MAQFSKVRILEVTADKAQVYKDGKLVEGEFKQRIRVLVVPVKPDPLYMNITEAGDEVINTFKALQGKIVLFPASLGVTDNGTAFMRLQAGTTIDDIDLLPEKAPKPAVMANAQQRPVAAQTNL